MSIPPDDTFIGTPITADDVASATAVPQAEPPAPIIVDYHYNCRKCRALLFRQGEIVPHDTTIDGKGNKRFKYQDYHEESRGECTSYFLDPDVTLWIAEDSRRARAEACTSGVVDPDTIYCVQCPTKVGAQSWVGSQCSCGAWVTPAFKIHAKAVDKLPIFGAPPPCE